MSQLKSGNHNIQLNLNNAPMNGEQLNKNMTSSTSARTNKRSSYSKEEEEIKQAIKIIKKENKISKLTRHFQIQRNEIDKNNQDSIREMQEMQNEKEIKEKLKYRGLRIVNCIRGFPVLNPDGVIMCIWDIVIFLLMIYTGVIMPYRISFIRDETFFWNVIETVIDFLFICDILVSLNLGFRNKENEYITDRWEIIKNYALGWLFIDILSSVPYGLIFKNKTAQKGTLLIRIVKLTKLNCFIRFFRLIKVVKFLRKISFIKAIFQLIQLNYGVSQLIIFLFFLVLLSHLVGCLWYFFPSLLNEENSWVTQMHLLDKGSFIKYLFSLYWTLTTVFTVGLGDIHAYNEIEYIISIIWMVFGVVFFSIIIGTLSLIISNSQSREIKLNKKLCILNEFAMKAKLNPLLKQKIEFVLTYSSNKEKITDDFAFLNGIPFDLKMEVAKIVQSGFLKDILFFSLYTTPEFIAMVIQFLTPMNFIKNEVIYEELETPMWMYFILEGRIYFTKNNFAYCTYVKGSYFGEIDLIEVKRIHSVVAAVNCEFVALSQNCFVNVIQKNFQEIYSKIQKLAKIRKKRLKNLEKKMMRLSIGEGIVILNMSGKLNLINSTIGNKFSKKNNTNNVSNSFFNGINTYSSDSESFTSSSDSDDDSKNEFKNM